MKNSIFLRLSLIVLFGLIFIFSNAQQTITLNPSEDAWIRMCLNPSYSYITTQTHSTAIFANSGEWTHSGYRIADRALMKFDLSSIPSGVVIVSAKLSLYAHNPQPDDNYKHKNYNTTLNSGYKLNACYLERVTQSWTETSVTWANQPATSTTNRIILPESQTVNQNYLDVDVTAMIKDMLANSTSNYGFMMRLVNEVKYARMAFCSKNYTDATRWPKLVIEYAPKEQVSATYMRSYQLKSDGTLWAWGDNGNGYLGIGSKTIDDISLPTQIGTSKNWIQISAGNFHNLAVKDDGTLWAWGSNYYYSVGDGTQIDRLAPVQIGTNTNWKKVSAGNCWSLALKNDGTIWGWGSINGASIPQQIGTDSDWKEISAGNSWALAIKTNGTLWMWGYDYGNLYNDGIDRSSPWQVGSANDWSKVSSGTWHFLAVKSNGTLWAWGNNGMGEVGDGSYIDRQYPVQISADTDWKQISAGAENFSQAVKTNGTLWTWGDNSWGQLGLGEVTDIIVPTKVMDITNVKQAASGFWHSIILKSDDQYCGTGRNWESQLGNGNTENRTTFSCTDLPILATGGYHSMLIKADKTLWTWGYNTLGQLGDGTTIDKNSPIQIGNGTDWAKIASQSSSWHSLAIKTDGSLWAWGRNEGGQCGDGTTITKKSPIKIGTDYDWWKIATGSVHSLALKFNGTLWLWGDDISMTAGDPSVYHLTPIQIGSESNWKAIAAGATFSVAIKENGTLWRWGGNTGLGLGNGSEIPIQVGAESDWKKIACGFHHVLAIKNNGTLWAWGNNSEGQIGDGTFTHRETPVQIGTDSDWAYISGGASNSIGIKTNGTLYTWGKNTFGELGDASITQRNYPGQVSGINCILSASGNVFSMILKSDGQYCGAGRNNWGQLGDGTNTNRTVFTCLSFPSSLKSAPLQPIIPDPLLTDKSKSYLLQNYPNPTQGSTNINYFISDDVNGAKIVLYNYIGGIVKEYPIYGKGLSKLEINLDEFSSGIYSYALFINGSKVDIKKLLLVK